MNRSSTLNAVSRAALAMIVGASAFIGAAARADHYPRVDVEHRHGMPSMLTRAEVLADLRIYQESGLAEAERVSHELGHDIAGLNAARERYVALRQGDRFAMLVMQISRRTGEPVRQARGV